MLRKVIKKLIILSLSVLVLTMQYDSRTLAAEAALPASGGSVSGNEVAVESGENNSVSGNSSSDVQTEESVSGNSDVQQIVKEENVTFAADEATVEKPVISPTQMQTTNYKDQILTDWQQIIEALGTLSPEALTNATGNMLVLQMQNVSGIPAGIRDALKTGDSGQVKALQCNVGYGVSLVFNGSTDNSGFNGISDASATVVHEKRGKKSMATTIRFGSHENLGTVVSLQVNLPKCEEGTKVSVYAETVSVDAAGNVTIGENVCIGNTKADANGNIEIPIQSMANYMFVYKAAKE